MSTIRTTHTGSLPRVEGLSELLVAHDEGQAVEGLDEAVGRAVADVVRHQQEVGLDLINDGEQGKIGYSTYVKERLTGFDGESQGLTGLPELAAHPDYAERMFSQIGEIRVDTPACTGPIELRDPQAVGHDIENLTNAADAAGVPRDRLFMTAASPGVVSVFFADQHYGDREAYLKAIADAMRAEYRAIAEAGITLQLDCPDLAMSGNLMLADVPLDEFRTVIEANVEALNDALRDVPAERSRIHLCWGNYEGPHTLDVGLADIIDIVLGAKPAGIVMEAANPRHGHEWAVFQDVKLPEDKYVVPGVVDSTSNFVEHPELVAQRLLNYARLVGPERVMAGTDCGFGTFVGLAQVAPSITWAKFASMVQGAKLASERI